MIVYNDDFFINQIKEQFNVCGEIRTIPDYPKYYASEDGQLFSSKRHKIARLKYFITSKGYYSMSMNSNKLPVHAIIALAFFGKIPSGLVVRHLDDNKLNNNINNLKYGTFKENSNDMVVNRNAKNLPWSNEKAIHKLDLIYQMGIAGKRIVDIASECDIGIGIISKILTGKRYIDKFNALSEEDREILFKRSFKPKRFYNVIETKITLNEIYDEIYKVCDKSSIIKQIEEFPHHYITSCGKLFSARNGVRESKQSNTNGYKSYNIRYNNNKISGVFHLLLAQYFIPNPNNHPLIRHLNGIKNDNRLENLAWGNYAQNGQDDVKHGKIKSCVTEEQAIEIVELLKQGKQLSEIAKKFNIKQNFVWKIKNKKRWKHLTQDIEFNKRELVSCLTPCQITQVIQLLQEGKLSNKEISNITGATNAQICLMRKKKNYKEYTKDIIFPNRCYTKFGKTPK